MAGDHDTGTSHIAGQRHMVFHFSGGAGIDRRVEVRRHGAGVVNDVGATGLCRGCVCFSGAGVSRPLSSNRLLAGSAWVAALCTVLIALIADRPVPAVILRFLTGMALAGVYPAGMKIMAT